MTAFVHDQEGQSNAFKASSKFVLDFRWNPQGRTEATFKYSNSEFIFLSQRENRNDRKAGTFTRLCLNCLI